MKSLFSVGKGLFILESSARKQEISVRKHGSSAQK